MDLDAEWIARCSATARRMGIANVQFEVGDLTRLERPASFDLIVSIDVLEHIPRRRKRCGASATPCAAAARSSSMCLRSGRGRCLRSVAARVSRVGQEGTHRQGEDADEFVALVRSADLDVVRWRRTFGYYSGELATSLFNLPYAPTLRNRVLQALLAPACRLLALSDSVEGQRTRYAVAVFGRRP